MTARHFDIAIIGNSLSAAIAATLLAKNGQRVILFGDRPEPDPAWFFSSMFLERLLGVLGGRACFTRPTPFQVLSSRSRLTIHGELPLEQELSREFGAAGARTAALLDQLREQGDRLNQLLWDNQGLPWSGLKSAARWRYLCMRAKIAPPAFEAPLLNQLKQYEPGPREFLTTLFQGLSLLPIQTLRVADGALLWAHASRQENLAEPEFSELLDQRFQQFHGVRQDLAELDQLVFKGTTCTGGLSQEGGEFQARWFLAGDLGADRDLWPKALKSPAPRPAVERFRTSPLEGQVSGLLEQQILVGGERPLRLALDTQSNGLAGSVAACAVDAATSIRLQLEPVLPFATYEMTTISGAPDNSSADPGWQTPALFSRPMILKNNILRADSSALLPAHGAAGAALLGWTLANQLGPAPAARK